MTVDLRHLRTLVAVAEAGSVTGAAARLNIEGSAVSRAIHDMEIVFGMPLFVRQARTAALFCPARSRSRGRTGRRTLYNAGYPGWPQPNKEPSNADAPEHGECKAE